MNRIKEVLGRNLNDSSIRGSLTTEFNDNQKWQSLTAQLNPIGKRGSLSTISKNFEDRVGGKHIITNHSYTHLEQ